MSPAEAEFVPRVLRAGAVQGEDARLLLNEYYGEIGVVQRDTPTAVQRFLGDADSALWIAYAGDAPAGCVVLRPLPVFQAAGECKRLYVRARFRRRGIAEMLLDAMEAHGRRSGLSWIYLDSKDDLEAALALYRRRRYEPCERYNDNAQATVFLRKFLTPG
jgi:ribosomal protein S18 acetylase RimI-like enzyme